MDDNKDPARFERFIASAHPRLIDSRSGETYLGSRAAPARFLKSPARSSQRGVLPLSA